MDTTGKPKLKTCELGTQTVNQIQAKKRLAQSLQPEQKQQNNRRTWQKSTGQYYKHTVRTQVWKSIQQSNNNSKIAFCVIFYANKFILGSNALIDACVGVSITKTTTGLKSKLPSHSHQYSRGKTTTDTWRQPHTPYKTSRSQQTAYWWYRYIAFSRSPPATQMENSVKLNLLESTYKREVNLWTRRLSIPCNWSFVRRMGASRNIQITKRQPKQQKK